MKAKRKKYNVIMTTGTNEIILVAQKVCDLPTAIEICNSLNEIHSQSTNKYSYYSI